MLDILRGCCGNLTNPGKHIPHYVHPKHEPADTSCPCNNPGIECTIQLLKEALFNKVDKAADKDLSSNDFTDEYKEKLDAFRAAFGLTLEDNVIRFSLLENTKIVIV